VYIVQYQCLQSFQHLRFVFTIFGTIYFVYVRMRVPRPVVRAQECMFLMGDNATKIHLSDCLSVIMQHCYSIANETGQLCASLRGGP